MGKNVKIRNILKHFFKTTVLEIDSNGNFVKEILNTREDFDISKISSIYDLFIPEDMARVERIFKTGIGGTKKYIKLDNKLQIKEFVDVDIKNIEGKIYLGLKYFDSNRDREIMYDRRIAEFAQKAELDQLTGLLNRYGYWERIKAMLYCGDPERKLGILLLDIDNLKKVNDEKGHKYGDKAISQISNLISSSLRKRDVGVRYGGDEFVIVVEELSGAKSSAYGLAKRLLKEINKKKGEYLVTLSIGVHTIKVGDVFKEGLSEAQLQANWEKEVAIADKMTYKAKDSGKNTVVFSEKDN